MARCRFFYSRGCADSPVTTPQFYSAVSASFTEDLQDMLQRFVFDNICKVVKVSMIVQEEETLSSDEPMRLGEETVAKDRTGIGRAERLKRGL
ncbi:hypothetical protein SUGI_1043540 [Cryptomeria japonica]|nr:hypothetical protein SUGI_1043540 [Cryptomeria japonica]